MQFQSGTQIETEAQWRSTITLYKSLLNKPHTFSNRETELLKVKDKIEKYIKIKLFLFKQTLEEKFEFLLRIDKDLPD